MSGGFFCKGNIDFRRRVPLNGTNTQPVFGEGEALFITAFHDGFNELFVQ
jgi:hypothetical protein